MPRFRRAVPALPRWDPGGRRPRAKSWPGGLPRCWFRTASRWRAVWRPGSTLWPMRRRWPGAAGRWASSAHRSTGTRCRETGGLRDAIRRTASAGVSVPVRSARAPVELPPAQQDHGAAAGCRADRRGGRQQRGRGTRAGRRSGWGGPRSFPSGRSKYRRRTGPTRGLGAGLSASTQPPGIGADEDQQPGRPQGPPPPMANPKPRSSARATA